MLGHDADETHPAYLNWDHPGVRPALRRAELPPGEPLLLISPYGPPKVRAVKKGRKLYLWDWSSVEHDGPCFENLVASQLLKYCHWVEDTEGYSTELRYLRDTDKREVDFVVLKERKPLFAVECKSGEKAVSPAIRYFAERTPIPHFYQVHARERHFSTGNATVLPFIRFCQELELP